MRDVSWSSILLLLLAAPFRTVNNAVFSLSPPIIVATRRSFFVKSIVGATNFFLLTASSNEDTTDADFCNQGQLAIESAIPGAYQSPCMVYSKRTIPIGGSNAIQISQGPLVGAGRTGVAVWNSGLLLAKLLQMVSQDFIQDKDIVELGCGTGLASIVCARVCSAHRVIATDGNSEVVELARENAMDNQCSNVLQVSQLSWGLLNAMDFVEEADTIIGSDLTYNPGTWPVLVETIDTILKPGGRFLYLTLGHSGFNVQSELNGFYQVAQTSFAADPSLQQRLEQELKRGLSITERQLLDSSGGVRILVLTKKS